MAKVEDPMVANHELRAWLRVKPRARGADLKGLRQPARSLARKEAMSWTEIVAEVNRRADRFRTGGSVAWFRGHADESYELKSTIHRHVDRFTGDFNKPLDAHARRELLRGEYKMLYRRFKADAWPLLDPREKSEWGIIFAMQHYGLPTRLLDWTESFACAVFFAQLRRNRAKGAAIWVLDPQALNHASLRRKELVALDDDDSPALLDSREYHPKWPAPACDLPSIAVLPFFTNARMTAQRAAFTISGDSSLPLDKEFPALVKEDGLTKLVLPVEASADADRFLEMTGLTAFSFYPDLQGLAMRHDAESERRMIDLRENSKRRFNKDNGII